MAIKANATTVISNTPNIDFARLKDVPQVVKAVSQTTTGDGTKTQNVDALNTSITYDQATFTLTFNYDTNCACACDCAQCNCACCQEGG